MNEKFLESIASMPIELPRDSSIGSCSSFADPKKKKYYFGKNINSKINMKPEEMFFSKKND